MNTTEKGSNVLRALPAGLLAAAVCMAGYPPVAASHSDSAAYAFGGLLAGHVFTDMRFRQQQEARERQQQTQALNAMAYGGGGQRLPAAPVAAAAAPMSPEQKLNQLDKLAAGGYITPAEYKARRKAILDSM
jgi:hypothetical protein